MLMDYKVTVEDKWGKRQTLDVLAIDRRDAKVCAKAFMGKEWEVVKVGEGREVKW